MNDELARKGSRSASEAPADVLLALAERCEREEPSYALDCQIEHLCAPERAHFIGNAKPYTTSLDAAVTLVPEWHRWSVETGTMCSAVVHNLEALFPGDRTKVTGRSARPAPALCAAALRARAAVAEASVSPAREAGRTPPPSGVPTP